MENDLGKMNLPELMDLIRRAADEVEIRMMQQAGADRCVCCGEIIPEGSMICPNCERKNYDRG